MGDEVLRFGFEQDALVGPADGVGALHLQAVVRCAVVARPVGVLGPHPQLQVKAVQLVVEEPAVRPGRHAIDADGGRNFSRIMRIAFRRIEAGRVAVLAELVLEPAGRQDDQVGLVRLVLRLRRGGLGGRLGRVRGKAAADGQVHGDVGLEDDALDAGEGLVVGLAARPRPHGPHRLGRGEVDFEALAADVGGRPDLVVLEVDAVLGPDQALGFVIIEGAFVDVEVQVFVALGPAVVVDDFDVVDQLGGDDAPAAEVLVGLAELLVEGQVRLLGPDGVDFDGLAVAVVVVEQRDADVIEVEPAVFLDGEVAGGDHHIFGVQLQLEGPLQFRAVLAESLAQLVFELESVRRRRPGRQMAGVGRQVGRGQRRQAVDAAQRAGVEHVTREEDEEAQRQQHDPLGCPHGLVPASSRSAAARRGALGKSSPPGRR